MRTRPCTTRRVSAVHFICGVAALLGGLSIFAAGLGSSDGVLGMAAPGALNVWVTTVERGPLRPVAQAEVAPAAMTAQIMARSPSLVAEQRPLARRFSGDGPGGRDGSAFRGGGDARNYLLATTTAHCSVRRSRAIMALDETSGHGAGEANRRAIRSASPGALPDDLADALARGTRAESALLWIIVLSTEDAVEARRTHC